MKIKCSPETSYLSVNDLVRIVSSVNYLINLMDKPRVNRTIGRFKCSVKAIFRSVH